MDKKVKGFTLIEMIVVIAIIAILAGMSSMAMQGYVRDSRIETNNRKAQLIYNAFTDMLIDCEINDDKSLFDGHYQCDPDSITGAVVFFRVAAVDAEGYKNKNGMGGLGDEIHIMARHRPGSTFIPWIDNTCSYSVWIEGTENPNSSNGGYGGCNHDSATDPKGEKGCKQWAKMNSYITRYMAKNMEGTYVVSVDLENYEVMSVIVRELVGGQDPKTGLYDRNEVHGTDPLNDWVNIYCGEGTYAGPVLIRKEGGTRNPGVGVGIVKDLEQEKDIARKSGVYMGCYPFGDSIYTNVTRKR